MNAEVISALPADLDFTELFDGWYNDWWAYLHPDAFTSKGLPYETLDAIFKGEYSAKIGSLDRIVEHFEKYSIYLRNQVEETRVNQRFAQILSQVPDGSTIYWHDQFFVQAISEVSDGLRNRGCVQIYYLHMTLPEELSYFQKGRELLHAISKMDVVYVHTDVYKALLKKQLSALSLSIPIIKRFDLGLDTKQIDQHLALINTQNYTERVEYSNLDESKKAFVDEVMRSQDAITHRFMDIGRLDLIKGSELLVDAFDEYFSSLDLSLEELKQDYRVFFIWPFKDFFADLSPYNIPLQYRIRVSEKVDQLVEKYPGVVFVSSELPRALIPAMLRNATGITAGTQEGLNLAIEEAIYVNGSENREVGIIIGMGAGLAIQYQPVYPGLAFYSKVGDVDSLMSAIEKVVELKSNNPLMLRENTKKFSEIIQSRSLDIMGR